jgi:phosphoesterase RecJ-like protein
MRQAVIDLIREARSITVFSHENPDADTLGAALALRIAAERLGKPAEVVCVDVPPPMLSFLPRVDEVRQAPSLEPDVAIVVDAGDLARIGSLATEAADWLSRARVVNIDHHVSNPGYGDAQLVEPAAAATCEIVAGLLPELGVEIDEELALALMAGIAADTRTFAHPNATPTTLRTAADLVAAGAPLSEINRRLYHDRPYSTLALWGMVLAGLEERCERRIVHASMTLPMLTAAGALPSASEGFIDLLTSVDTAEISVLFKEAEGGEIRVSVRTRAAADAVAITAAFGGGGHARAAGCTVPGPLDAARRLVLAECERELARADAGGR